MNWEAIGAIGEILGAIAVIGTLAYLAVQVRHLKSELHVSSFRDMTESFAGVSNSVATSPELAAALEKANAGESLTPVEIRMLDSHFISWMNAFELLYTQVSTEAIEIQQVTIAGVLTTFLSQERWARGYWDRKKNYWSKNFQAVIDAEYDRIGAG